MTYLSHATVMLCALLALLAAPVLAQAPQPDEFAQAMAQLRDGDDVAARARLLALSQANDPRAQDVLAAMLAKGVGGAASLLEAMRWYCMLAHHREGGRATVNALWRLAEFYRTGGGQPGLDYLTGDPGAENPVKALFWYRVMALQERYYQAVLPEGVRLGRIGAGMVRRALLPAELDAVEARLAQWSPGSAVPDPARCLALP